jgi:hypothetical protein
MFDGIQEMMRGFGSITHGLLGVYRGFCVGFGVEVLNVLQDVLARDLPALTHQLWMQRCCNFFFCESGTEPGLVQF